MLSRYWRVILSLLLAVLLAVSAQAQRRELARIDEILADAYGAAQAFRSEETNRLSLQVIDECKALIGKVNSKRQPQFMAQLHDRQLQALDLIARPLLDQGYGNRVRFMAERYLQQTITRIGPRYHSLARTYRLLGDEAALRGDTARALDWYKKGQGLNYIPGGEAAIIFADLHDALALLWAGRGDFRLAYQEWELGDQLLKKNLKKNHPAFADRWHHYAQICSLQGDFSVAHDFMEKAFRLQQSAYGEGSLQTVELLIDRGELWQAQGQFAAAEQTFRQAQSLCTSPPEGFRPILLRLQMAQARLARVQRQPREALQFLEAADKLAGTRADSTALRFDLHRIRTDLLLENHRFGDALNSVLDWEQARKDLHLNDHESNLQLRLLKGKLLTELGRFDTAEPFLRHVMAWRREDEQAPPARRWAAAEAYIQWAGRTGRDQLALELLSESVGWAAASPCLRAAWAAEHAELSERTARLSDWLESARFGLGEIEGTGCEEERLRLYELVARAELRQGDALSAKALLEYVLQARDRRNEHYHPQMGRIYRTLAEAHLHDGRTEEAQQALAEARRIFQAVYSDRHITRADLLVLEAQIVRAAGKNDKFMELAVDAWALYDRLPQQPSAYRVRLNLLLTEWYALKGQIERADRYLGYALASPVGRDEFDHFFENKKRAQLLTFVRTVELVRALVPPSEKGRGRRRSR